MTYRNNDLSFIFEVIIIFWKVIFADNYSNIKTIVFF